MNGRDDMVLNDEKDCIDRSEWNLSDKITRVGCESVGGTAIECDSCGKIFSSSTRETWTHPDKFVPLKDVREFIKRLKELGKATSFNQDRTESEEFIMLSMDDFDKLAGEKLV